MKTFTKKRGFFAATAALLIVTAMLVTTWCSNDIGDSNEYTDNFTPPAGKGAVRLSFNKNIVRTILPDDADVDIFNEFEFQFTPTSSLGGSPTGSSVSKILAKGNETDPIILDPGFYDLIVVAKIKVNNIMEPAAENETAVSVEIKAGKITNEAIVLKAHDPATGKTGTFSYTLTGLVASDFATADTATITLTPIGSLGSNIGPLPVKSQFNGSTQSIPSIDTGFYYVDFTLKVATDIVTFRHVVHIYPNMISHYDFTVSLNYFNAVFKLEDGDITFTPITDKDIVIHYDINDTHADANPSPTPFDEYDGTPIVLHRGDKIVFTVNNSALFTANSFEWYCLSDTPLPTTNNTINCTINTAAAAPSASYNPFSTAKYYTLSVVGELIEDHKQYATVVEFSVIP